MRPVVLDGGNLFFPKARLRDFEREQFLFKARCILEAYNRIGVDALALGPRDFAAGLDNLLELRGDARFPFLCANLLDRGSGKALFEPYRIVERDGHRIGLLGVIDTADEIDGLEEAEEGLRVEPIYSSVKRISAALRAQGCELVVVISAIAPKHVRVLAKSIPDVDLYVTGDPDDKLRIPWMSGGAMVANASQLGKYLGHVQVLFGDSGSGPPSLSHHFVAMKPDYFDEPAVKRIVDRYYRYVAVAQRRDPERSVKEDEQEVNLKYGNAAFVSATECETCHPRQVQLWQESRHARAFTDLPSEDRGRLECLECHVTGLGRWSGFSLAGGGPDLGGVQCEVCHGPGSMHPAADLTRGAEAVGRVCRDCHTRSRSPDFKLGEYLARISCACGE